jgi:hypothetical protein
MRITISVEKVGNDWVMLELQGAVETVGSASFDGNQLGTMTFDKGGAPVLEIGRHQIKVREAPCLGDW